MQHWLLVRKRIDFKLCLLVYKRLHQLAAPYLESMISPVSAVSTRRHLRSAVGQGDLTVPRTRTVGVGPRNFSVAGPSLWNTLPSDMKQSSLSIAQFCSQFKLSFVDILSMCQLHISLTRAAQIYLELHFCVELHTKKAPPDSEALNHSTNHKRFVVNKHV